MYLLGKVLFAILVATVLLYPKPANEPAIKLMSVSSKYSVADLTGSYFFGDGLGVNCSMEIKPNKTFVFKWTGCLGVYDQNFGSFDLSGEEIVMHPAKPNKREGFLGMAERFFPVRWDDRMFLIAEADILGFTSSSRQWIESGSFPRRSYDYYMRLDRSHTDDESSIPKGMPDVPEIYRKYLYHPLETKVKAVVGHTLKIDKGSADGLTIGTKLTPTNKKFTWFVVETLSTHSATLKPWDSNSPLPKVGITLQPFAL